MQKVMWCVNTDFTIASYVLSHSTKQITQVFVIYSWLQVRSRIWRAFILLAIKSGGSRLK